MVSTKEFELEKVDQHDALKIIAGLAAFTAVIWMIVYFIKKG